MAVAREVSFDSNGLRCAGDLYLPDKADGTVPCVVMGHGGSGTKRLGLPGYAEAFAAHGMSVLAFDYRHFGASGGQPRQVIDVAEQQDDCRAPRGKPPYFVPVVAEPGHVAVFTEPDAGKTFELLGGFAVG